MGLGPGARLQIITRIHLMSDLEDPSGLRGDNIRPASSREWMQRHIRPGLHIADRGAILIVIFGQFSIVATHGTSNYFLIAGVDPGEAQVPRSS